MALESKHWKGEESSSTGFGLVFFFGWLWKQTDPRVRSQCWENIRRSLMTCFYWIRAALLRRLRVSWEDCCRALLKPAVTAPQTLQLRAVVGAAHTRLSTSTGGRSGRKHVKEAKIVSKNNHFLIVSSQIFCCFYLLMEENLSLDKFG